jgi:hypothetical protein
VKRVLLAALLGAVGCGHTETHQAMLRNAQAPTGRPVELYMADQPTPARPFYEIALVQAIGFGSDAHPEDVARSLTEKAGALGCDAVVRTFIDIGYSRAHAAGVCVKWLAPGPAGPTAVLPADPGKNPPPPPVRSQPAPKIEPLPSSPPGSGNTR